MFLLRELFEKTLKKLKFISKLKCKLNKLLIFFFFLSGDLCRPLNCKKKEMCLLEDAFTAVCVSKKELQKNGYVI